MELGYIEITIKSCSLGCCEEVCSSRQYSENHPEEYIGIALAQALKAVGRSPLALCKGLLELEEQWCGSAVPKCENLEERLANLASEYVDFWKNHDSRLAERASKIGKKQT